MTLQVKLTNLNGTPYHAKVERFQLVDGKPVIFPEQTQEITGRGEEQTITLWGDQGVMITEAKAAGCVSAAPTGCTDDTGCAAAGRCLERAD